MGLALVSRNELPQRLLRVELGRKSAVVNSCLSDFHLHLFFVVVCFLASRLISSRMCLVLVWTFIIARSPDAATIASISLQSARIFFDAVSFMSALSLKFAYCRSSWAAFSPLLITCLARTGKPCRRPVSASRPSRRPEHDLLAFRRRPQRGERLGQLLVVLPDEPVEHPLPG